MGNRTLVTDDSSQTSFDELYRAHYARITRLCRLLLHDSQEAEEAAQEVFLKLLRASNGFSRTIAWESWLTRVALNTCRDRRRSWWWRWRHAEPIERQILQLPSIEPTPEEITVSREQRERIWKFLRGLSTRQREVFVLRYVEEWSGEEVAGFLGLTTGSVKRHLFRAVHRMRQALGGHT